MDDIDAKPNIDREDVDLKRKNISEVEKWINHDEAADLSTIQFLISAQEKLLDGFDVLTGFRTSAEGVQIGNRFVAPKDSARQLTEKLAAKIDEMTSSEQVDPENLKVWASTVLVAIHPFRDANGRSARALMAYIGRKMGQEDVSILDSYDNFYRVQDSHEDGIRMMTKMYIRKKYPDLKIPIAVKKEKKEKSDTLAVLEYIASRTGTTYDQVVTDMIQLTIESISPSNILDHPVVIESSDLSENLDFDRSQLYKRYKQLGIANFPYSFSSEEE